MLKQPFVLVGEAPHHAPLVEDLNDRAFGPGRLAKTAYRLREGREPLHALSFVAMDGEVLIGSVRHWAIRIGDCPALLLGPLAVDPARQGEGIGCGLIRLGLDRAKALGHRLVVLVGDPPYYARTGFRPVPIGQIALPGPVDYQRLLYVELEAGALEAAVGLARPA